MKVPRSIFRGRPLAPVDDQHLNRTLLRLQFQLELFLNRD
jgi:hypothetical protein